MLTLAVRVQTSSGEELTHLKWASLEIFWTEFRREKDLAPPRGNQQRNPRISTNIYTRGVKINDNYIFWGEQQFLSSTSFIIMYLATAVSTWDNLTDHNAELVSRWENMTVSTSLSFNDNGGWGRETRGCITITDQAKSVCSVLSHVGRLLIADTSSSAVHTPTPWGTSPVTYPSSPPLSSSY